jgi:hypothetical protein
MAEYYAVHGIPTLILIGRDGKVISTNARGRVLGDLVEKALAAPAPAAADLVADNTGAFDDSSSADTPAEKPKATKGKKGKAKAAPSAMAAARTSSDDSDKHPSVARPEAPKPREWTDASGSFHKTAAFHGMGNKVVKLLLEDGSVISVPLEKLSDEDQKYIEDRSKTKE